MSTEQTLVSYGALKRAMSGQFESVANEAGALGAQVGETGGNLPQSQAELISRLSHALTMLEAEERHEGVMATAQDPVASLLQTYVALKATEAGQLEPAPAGGLEAKFDNHDFLGWAGSFFSWWKKIDPHPFVTAPDQPETLPDDARIALLADWGSGLYGAPVCSRSIAADGDGYQMVMHLGDVYYSGNEDEIADRFLKYWPQVPGAVSRGLNGNHEMYTGGKAYFKQVLPAFGQQASYFAAQNDHFLLVGLDSAYKDADLAGDQVAWLQRLLAQAADRKVILFSHHQPFSWFGSQGTKLVGSLGSILDEKKIFAWYWGHEHRCVVYQPHPLWGLHGRCIGHSGFPYFRDKLGPVPATPSWHKLDDKNLVPGGIVLDGPNRYIVGHENDYGPHGYVTLEIQDGRLTELVHDADGTLLLEQQLV